MNKRDLAKRISLLLAAALVFSGCGTEAEGTSQEAASAIAVRAAEAELGTLTVSNQFVGTVSPQQQVSIVPLVSGEVDAVYAQVGDEVKAGDVLFHINDEAAKLQKESAELSKQGAELSAQMQLGSAQVMNNISMQSNIRSLEYQLAMAKDQYNAAVEGIADAEEAQEEMNSALDGINQSVKELQENQEEMEAVVSDASQYIDPASIVSGKYAYVVAYNYKKDPSHYRWSDTPADEETSGQEWSEPEDETETGTDTEAGQQNGAVSRPQLPSAGFPVYETEETAEKEENGEAADETAGSESTHAEDGDHAAEPRGEEAEDGQGTDEEAEDGQGTDEETEDGQDTDEETESVSAAMKQEGSGAAAMAYAPEAAANVYFSVETVKEVPMLLAANDSYDEYDGDTPDYRYTTTAQAWEAYNKQQKINKAARAAEEMGYSAEDIGSGAAMAEVMENSVQIIALQYQASQLSGNQASVESSIRSAESAKDTTAKTIDFYEDSLENAQVTYGISNGQAYQDTAGALATQIQAADVGVRSAALQLEYYSPTTPISGTVVSKTVEQYGLVQAGYAAYVISNQDAMNVTFAVSGQVRETLRTGMPVTLEKNGSTYTGTITEIGETVEQQSGGLFLIKAITEADGGKLASGTAVKLTVDTFRSENAVLIPYDAVHFESEQAYVFAIIDHKAVRTPVTIGLMNDDMVEVTEGLTAGTQVVATWSSQLEDGVALRIIGESTEDTAEGSGVEAADREQDGEADK